MHLDFQSNKRWVKDARKIADLNKRKSRSHNLSYWWNRWASCHPQRITLSPFYPCCCQSFFLIRSSKHWSALAAYPICWGYRELLLETAGTQSHSPQQDTINSQETVLGIPANHEHAGFCFHPLVQATKQSQKQKSWVFLANLDGLWYRGFNVGPPPIFNNWFH